jgi:hypothetical protein
MKALVLNAIRRPFESGVGREYGRHGIEAFVGTRAIFESCEGALMSHESVDDSINI